jgi:hypothetical protein
MANFVRHGLPFATDVRSSNRAPRTGCTSGSLVSVCDDCEAFSTVSCKRSVMRLRFFSGVCLGSRDNESLSDSSCHWIHGTDAGDCKLHEAQNLLGCTAVFLIQGACCLHHQGPDDGRTSETSVDIQLRTRQYIPEDSELHTRRRENLDVNYMLAFWRPELLLVGLYTWYTSAGHTPACRINTLLGNTLNNPRVSCTDGYLYPVSASKCKSSNKVINILHIKKHKIKIIQNISSSNSFIWQWNLDN